MMSIDPEAIKSHAWNFRDAESDPRRPSKGACLCSRQINCSAAALIGDAEISLA